VTRRLLLLAALLALPLLIAPETGWASAYADGVMEGVVRHRFANDWWPVQPDRDWYTVAVYAATTDCREVGRIVLMRPVGMTQWQRALVADCGGNDSISWMLSNSIIAELDAGTFERWTTAHGRPLRIEVAR
jgi:hypothetical protein